MLFDALEKICFWEEPTSHFPSFASAKPVCKLLLCHQRCHLVFFRCYRVFSGAIRCFSGIFTVLFFSYFSFERSKTICLRKNQLPWSAIAEMLVSPTAAMLEPNLAQDLRSSKITWSWIFTWVPPPTWCFPGLPTAPCQKELWGDPRPAGLPSASGRCRWW